MTDTSSAMGAMAPSSAEVTANESNMHTVVCASESRARSKSARMAPRPMVHAATARNSSGSFAAL